MQDSVFADCVFAYAIVPARGGNRLTFYWGRSFFDLTYSKKFGG